MSGSNMASLKQKKTVSRAKRNTGRSIPPPRTRGAQTDSFRAMFAPEPTDGDDRRGFNRGVAYAVALLVGTWDEPTIAAHIIRKSGITLAEFELSGVDGFDLGEVRHVFATEPGTTRWVRPERTR